MPRNDARIQSLLSNHRLDALVVTGPSNVQYIAGTHSWLDPLLKEWMVVLGGSDDLAMRAFAVATADGRTAVVLNAGLVGNSLAAEVDEVHVYGPRVLNMRASSDEMAMPHRELLTLISNSAATPALALQGALDSLGVANGRVGADFEAFPPGLRQAVQGSTPGAEWGDASQLVRLIRAVKSPTELELLRAANTAADDAFAQAIELARPGLAFEELVHEFRLGLAQRGASLDHFAYAVGGVSLATHGRELVPSSGSFAIDYGCILDGYFSDSAATMHVGAPTPEAVGDYNALLACIEAGIRGLVPGRRASEVRADMGASIATAGILVEGPTGHGLGLQLRDLPIVLADNGARLRDDYVDLSADLVVEAGMVMNLEVIGFVPGRGSVEVEKTLVVTQEGGLDLAQSPRMAMVQVEP